MKSELESFMEIWGREAKKTVRLLEALPQDGYDFRPDPEGRSLGEMAWHLAEGEAYGSFGIERGGFSISERPPGIARPKTVAELAPGFQRVHEEAAARLRALTPEDLDRSIASFSGQPTEIRHLLWDFILLHGIHHRGQLTLMSRQAGGRPAGMFGPTREEMPLPRSKS
jgi:uncharacterized damage-inducible protein DinB